LGLTKICHTCQQAYSDDVEFCPRDGARLAAQATETEAQLAAGLSRRFRLVRRLGQGGMGTVFLAKQIGVGNRPVALKVLNRKLLDDPDFLLRFQNEAGSTGRISHANVVTIYESAQADDGTPYIAMQFLEGESLREALQRRGALPVPEVAEILQQAARGLNAAHKLGIIHRDLKPDNLFLTRGDEGELVVKVVDFGIAKLRESAMHTQTGMVLGTPAYMSYEQASGMRSDELDARSDVYSMGVVVYEMLSGRAPFHSDTPVGYLRKHLMDEPPPFRAVAPGLGVPPAAESAVMKALAKDRNQRHASVPDFARAFMAAEQPAPAAEFSQPLSSTKIVPPPATREPVAPMPVFASATAPADNAVQTPPPAPPERIMKAPPPHGSKPGVTPSRPPAAPKPPQFAKAPEPASKMKFVALAVVALILIVGVVWYFSPQTAKDVNSGESIKKGDVSWSAKAGESKGEVRVNHNDGLKYVWIPPGTFMMGCSPGDRECGADEKPAHKVTITKGFWLGQTEVTVAAYRRFAGSTGAQMPPAPDFNADWNNHDMPIVNVSWDDATALCGWAGGRLPTEAEWEYAARAGSTEARYGPIDEVAWYSNNSGQKTHEVGQKRANGFGLYDVLGNVWEWVNDWYDQNYYQNSPSQVPSGPASGQLRLLRGGSWNFDPRYVRVSFRGWFDPAYRGDYVVVGLRCGGEVARP
jgi:serine/threonine-protein kinase